MVSKVAETRGYQALLVHGQLGQLLAGNIFNCTAHSPAGQCWAWCSLPASALLGCWGTGFGEVLASCLQAGLRHSVHNTTTGQSS